MRFLSFCNTRKNGCVFYVIKWSVLCFSIIMALKVDKPSSFLPAGASGVGKTFWIFRLIDHRDEIFSETIEKILYFYEVWQPIFEEYSHCVDFFHGAPTVDILKSPEPKLVVLDDLMNSNRDIITKIFTVYSHHYNFSVLFTTQNLLNKQIREISLNSKFVVFFKNCRDLRQIESFFCVKLFPQTHARSWTPI